jgi:LmbE family N-acetylglucosaminyl deacetylase
VGQPLLVVSPHLDDAVLSAGCLLAAHPGSVVATVLTADRPPHQPPTEWDCASGLDEPGVNPPGVRRREDRGALEVLGAAPCWLDVLESQYGGEPDVDTISSILAGVLESHPAAPAVMPLGLWHEEHTVVHRACRRLFEADPTRTWFAYADVPYRGVDGRQHLADRLAELQRSGLNLVPQPVPAEGLRSKCFALAHYRSQLRALAGPGRPGWRDALEPEQCWRLEAATQATCVGGQTQ